MLSEPLLAARTHEPIPGGDRKKSRRDDRVARQAVTAIGLIAMLGLVPWLGTSIYRDEGASLYSAHLSWSNLWAQSQHVDLVFLPYYVLLHLWMLVSGTIEWARLPSLLAYGATVIVAGRVGLRIAGRWCGIVTAALTASNTLLIQRALNARPYALSALTATLCAAVLLAWLNDGRRRRLWLFSILGIATALLQIFAVLAPLSMVAALLAARPARLAVRLRAMLWPIGTLVVVAGAFALLTVGQVGQINWIAGGSSAQQIGNARGPAIGNLYDLALFAMVIIVVIVPYYLWPRGGRAMWTKLLSRDRDPLAVALGWALLPILVLALASTVHPVLLDRYATASAPGLALLFGLVSARVVQLVRDPRRRTAEGRSKPRGRWLAWTGAALSLVLALNYWTAASTVNEDLKGLALYVVDHAHSGDVIVPLNHSQATGVQYYLDRDGHQIAVWPQMGVQQRFVEAFDLVVPTKPNDLPPRLWVVNDGQSYAPSNFIRSVIDHYALLGIHRFSGVSVWLYGR
jgi:mannosyltransferase